MVAAPLLAATTLALPSCNLARAKAKIKSSHVTIPGSQSISSEPYRVAASQADRVTCVELAGHDAVAMAVTLASGGTAGDVGWVVFVGGSHGYRLSLVRGGYKLGLARVGSDLVETDPVYKPSDPNCCPSGGFDHTCWHWDGARFRVARSWHDRSYKA
jgi:hypothetical protein